MGGSWSSHLVPAQTYLKVDQDVAGTLERKRNYIHCLIVRTMKQEKEMHIDNLVFKVRGCDLTSSLGHDGNRTYVQIPGNDGAGSMDPLFTAKARVAQTAAMRVSVRVPTTRGQHGQKHETTALWKNTRLFYYVSRPRQSQRVESFRQEVSVCV